MGRGVETKKKKGRPSLLDLQKRTLKEQQEQKLKRNNSAPHSYANCRTATASTPNSLRRSTRRNLNPDDSSTEKVHEEEYDDDDADELEGKRREKKLKLVLKMPNNQKSSLNSESLNSYESDSNAEEDNAASISGRKRKINEIKDGSGIVDGQKGDKSCHRTNPSNIHQAGATKLDSGPSTPLPDKKLILFILERLQKKDTYGVYSEPVDPNELPDYHEVIEHPMDFGTVRKKLTNGAYTNLEMFEKDVFLICSNAMQYNSPDTIYFRQARSIQELAKKNFENLRQSGDDNEPEPKIVRRGRPPTKHKKPLGRPPLERTGSEFSSDATLATGGENATWLNHDLRKGAHVPDKSGFADNYGQGSRDVHPSWLVDSKFERNEDHHSGSVLRGNSKYGKKQFIPDENRRNTYLQSYPSDCGREPSVLATFDGERKQLMPIGIHYEHSYARSLARFAANLGPVAWKVASIKIERCLPAGVKFGLGWVGEDDTVQHRPPLISPNLQGQLSEQQPVSASILINSSSAATSGAVGSKGDKVSAKLEADNLSDRHVSSCSPMLDNQISKHLPLSARTVSSPSFANKSPESFSVKPEINDGLRSNPGFNTLNSNINPIGPKPPFQMHQNTSVRPGINGYNGAYGFNQMSPQMAKLIGQTRASCFQSSQILDSASRTNTNFNNPATANSLNSEKCKFSDNRNAVNFSSSLPNTVDEGVVGATSGPHPRPSLQGLSLHQKPDSRYFQQQKPDSVRPDLNIIFQTPGSPSSTRVDSTQPDLVLQL